LRDAFLDLGKRGAGVPHIVFLQNHGVFVAAETIDEIDSLYDGIMETIGRAAADALASVGALDTSASARPAPRPEAAASAETANAEAVCAAAIRSLAPGGFTTFETGGEIDRFVASASAFAPLDGAFTPDHIVYAGARPLFVRRPVRDEDLDSSIGEAWRAFVRDEGFSPRIAAVQGIGIFAVGKTEKASALSMKLFLDAVRIARYATAFGGPRHMGLKDAEFIKKWEVEQYRASVAAR
jgi:rhamnose utilization protein RhaD (predicted bifunctional aldolase and dehydrogenase)